MQQSQRMSPAIFLPDLAFQEHAKHSTHKLLAGPKVERYSIMVCMLGTQHLLLHSNLRDWLLSASHLNSAYQDILWTVTQDYFVPTIHLFPSIHIVTEC